MGVKIDSNLSWQCHHVNHLSIKLNRAILLLFKTRQMLALKYYDSSILQFLTPTYLAAFLSWLIIVAIFNQY